MSTWKQWQAWLVFRPWQRHGLVLMVGGLVHILIGVSFLITDELSFRQEQSLVVALEMMPLTSWGVVFIFAGLMSCVSSRWPQFSETWGYMVLCGLSSGWSAIYTLGYFLGNAPFNTNAPGALLWALMAFMWWAVSGLVNPDKTAVMRHDSS